VTELANQPDPPETNVANGKELDQEYVRILRAGRPVKIASLRRTTSPSAHLAMSNDRDVSG